MFTVHHVSDAEKLKEIYRLRYKVYCEEWGFERPGDHPYGIETDEFDKSAVHFVAKNSEGNLVGTIRLILNSPAGFPVEKYCEININKHELPRESLAEISRLAISKEYRRRAEDRYVYGPDEERRSIGRFNYTGKIYHSESSRIYRRAEDRYKEVLQDRRKRPEAVISLYKAIYHESKRRQITHWYAVMTKGLYTLLRRLEINFQAIGDPVDYHGIRTPYLGDIERIEHEVSIKNPELYEEFTKELKGF